MTNSYNLSPHPRIVFIHGFNNNHEAFQPLMDLFKSKGVETKQIILPGHGEDRGELKSHSQAFKSFKAAMHELGPDPYLVIAFSLGALYLQLWMNENPANKPTRQLLLAPSFYIRQQYLFEKIVNFIPSFFIIRSFAPKAFQRFGYLKISEYRTFLAALLLYQKDVRPYEIPTMVMIDPKDEIVDVERLNEEIKKKNPEVEVILWDRTYLVKGTERHHIMFHPDYFKANDWNMFIDMIENYFYLKNTPL